MSDNPLGRLDPKKTADNMIRLQERIAALEGRVGEVERRGRTDSARFKATRRRDRLRRGGR